MEWLAGILRTEVAFPAAVFIAFVVTTLWLRRLAYRGIARWSRKVSWPGAIHLAAAARTAALWSSITIGLLLAIGVSVLDGAVKSVAEHALWSVLVVILFVTAAGLARRLILDYLAAFQVPHKTSAFTSNAIVVALLVVAFLMVLGIWEVPIGPLMLLIGVAAVAALLTFREGLANLFAAFQLAATGQMKVGDYIKLDSGEEGYVKQMTWRNLQLEGLNASFIIIPNHRLIQAKVTNYGRPLKQAKEPFHFYTRFHLKELTNLKARNLRELVDVLKTAPDSVVYYHTHHFLEEHHFLTPEPPNDFALWVEDSLGNEVLAERLASVDTFEFPNLTTLRDRIVGIIEEYIARTSDSREALRGQEFHFIKTASAIMPLPYVAHDLREFVEALRAISLGSLYFHIFESRLRLGRGVNDFSKWMRDSLDEPDLANKVAALDPYGYTLEGLRSLLIQLVEKRVK